MSKKQYLFFLSILFCGACFVFVMRFDRQHLGAEIPEIPGGGKEIIGNVLESMAKEFNDKIIKLKSKLESLKSLVTNIKLALKDARYETTSKIDFLTEEKDGFSLDFGYSGAGPVLEPFKGFESKITISDVPEEWAPALRKALVELGLGAFTTVTPAQEWLLKVILLSKDRIEKILSNEDFLRELSLLMSRLVFTPGFDTMGKVVESISPTFKTILDNITLKGGKALDMFNSFYTKIHAALQRSFPKKIIGGQLVADPAYVPNGSSLTDGQVRSVLFSLCVKAMLFYAQLKNEYEKTDPGKAAFLALSKSKEEGRLVAIEAFNKNMPKMDDLKVFIASELNKIINRMTNKAYESELGLLAAAFFGSIGLPFDDLLKSAKVLEYKAEIQGKAEAILDSLDVGALAPSAFA